ncbi:MAG TPA: AMP-binding protein [Candidatus Fermentibacter daniensis]|nr:AMP-binding protein [Candidatus Fermentibacter daniensis]HPH40577.1 AMP-binding protein [Candidatus Fermentibacter daniensis]
MLQASASIYKDKPFLLEKSPDGSWMQLTYSEFSSAVDLLAKALIGIEERPVVGLTGSNSVAWATVFMATLRAGGIIVPIDKELPAAEIHTILHYSGASILFHDAQMPQDLQTSIPSKQTRTFQMRSPSRSENSLESLLDAGASSEARFPLVNGGDDIALISYTSGTMGAAKGVVLSHRNILSDLRQMLQAVGLVHDEVFLSVLPMHHMYECVCGFLCPLCHGCTIYFCRGLRYVAEDLADAHATLILGVPLLWENMYRKIQDGVAAKKAGRFKFRIGLAAASIAEMLGDRDVRRKIFSPVHEKLGGRARFLVSGGAGIDAAVVAGFRKMGMEMLQGYGLTECSPIVAVNRDTANRTGSVGPPLPEIEVRIEDPDESGIGEIVVKGPNIMLGYHNAPEATAEVLSRDGWFHTGDYGFLDRDGFLFVTGRKKNVIVAKNGKNVYPEELESKLCRSGLIQECMVFGKESELKGEEIWVVAFPNRERLIEMAEQQGQPLTEEFAVDVVRREIANLNASQAIYKRISNFILRETELPKTTTKKIKRTSTLREAGLGPIQTHKVIRK